MHPGTAMSAALIVAVSSTRKKHTPLSTAGAPKKGPYLKLTAACTRSTYPRLGEEVGL